MLWRQCRETAAELVYNHYTSALDTQRRGLLLHLFLVAELAELLCILGRLTTWRGRILPCDI